MFYFFYHLIVILFFNYFLFLCVSSSLFSLFCLDLPNKNNLLQYHQPLSKYPSHHPSRHHHPHQKIQSTTTTIRPKPPATSHHCKPQPKIKLITTKKSHLSNPNQPITKHTIRKREIFGHSKRNKIK